MYNQFKYLTVTNFTLKVRETLTSAQTPHYVFNNHILTELCQNLSRYRLDDDKDVAQVILFCRKNFV